MPRNSNSKDKDAAGPSKPYSHKQAIRRCYNCRQPGHTRDKCPKATTDATVLFPKLQSDLNDFYQQHQQLQASHDVLVQQLAEAKKQAALANTLAQQVEELQARAKAQEEAIEVRDKKIELLEEESKIQSELLVKSDKLVGALLQPKKKSPSFASISTTTLNQTPPSNQLITTTLPKFSQLKKPSKPHHVLDADISPLRRPKSIHPSNTIIPSSVPSKSPSPNISRSPSPLPHTWGKDKVVEDDNILRGGICNRTEFEDEYKYKNVDLGEDPDIIINTQVIPGRPRIPEIDQMLARYHTRSRSRAISVSTSRSGESQNES
jgi:hypothetical protein